MARKTSLKDRVLPVITVLKERYHKGKKQSQKRWKKIGKKIFGGLFYLPPYEDVAGMASDREELSSFLRPTVRFGFFVMVAVIVFFIGWGTLAPMDSAAIAPGYVVLDSNRKTVQHLEGGIIGEIFVKEGDEVQKGQLLIRLDTTAAKAKREIILSQLYLAKATEARLIAERDSEGAITFDPQLVAGSQNFEVAKILKGQESLFRTRQDAIRQQVDILQQKIQQFNNQITGLEAQVMSAKKQNSLIRDEIITVTELLKKGLAKKPRLLELQRMEAELTGRAGEYLAEIARVKEGITETQYEMLNAKSEYIKETLESLKETQKDVASLSEELLASQDILTRTEIIAPQAGKITGLKYHTVGGVIEGGGPVMDIVPVNDKLIVEARIVPTDIDIVHTGLKAKVMLTAYKSRFVPRLEGTVIDVSGDSFANEQTGETFYKARIEIPKEALEELTTKVELYPGMPAEVFVVTGESTLLDYLLSPIIDSFHRAFKEK